MLMSGITAVYDSKGELSSFSETLIYENAEKNFEVSVYENGALVNKQDIGERYVPNSELRTYLEDLSQNDDALVTPMGWGEKVGCVAATLGVGVVFAKIIVSVCGTSCAAAATGVGAAVCGACITGIVGVAGASLTAIYHCFQL
nr:MAG TPA: hypothetical protein [Caudoviricetes sp.]